MIRGECNCGAVRFEVEGEPRGIYVCHCSICRRATGAHGIAVLVVPKTSLRWLQGQEQMAQWSKPGADWHTWFCRVCGSRVPGENDAHTLFVPAGCLTEGGEALRVRHHLFIGSKAAWDEIGDAGELHWEGLSSPASPAP